MTRRILSGMQPTNNLHLGNYLGALKNWVDMQKEYECLFCVVDLHAITVPQDPKDLFRNTREIAAAYIAAGVDPKNCVIFPQSQVSAHAELGWVLNTMTPMGWLNRMTQFKDKAGKNKEKAGLGLYAYPVLMAADILIYQATHVPVGDDQKQHLELAREIAGAFNRRYDQDFFTLPEPQILGDATRVMSLRDGTSKMSKSADSDMSRINLIDDADTIAKKIKKAKTDPMPLPSSVEELEGRPEARNLMVIYGALTEKSLAQVVDEFAGKEFSQFKPALADVAVEKLAPITNEMNHLLNNIDEIDAILMQGAEKANEIAQKNLRDIYDIVGFWKPQI